MQLPGSRSAGRASERILARERPDLVLLGCVQSKRPGPSSAKDLYDSPLWRARRAYAERIGASWFILSAEHGLLSPDSPVSWYDKTLASLPATGRRAWSRRVLDALRAEFPNLSGKIVEIHAGKLYSGYGVADGLEREGAIVRQPLRGIAGIGNQLRWYAAHPEVVE